MIIILVLIGVIALWCIFVLFTLPFVQDIDEEDKLDLHSLFEYHPEIKEEAKCYCGHTIYCDCGPQINDHIKHIIDEK